MRVALQRVYKVCMETAAEYPMLFPAGRLQAYWAGQRHGKSEIHDPTLLCGGEITAEGALAATVAATLLAIDRRVVRRFFSRQQAGDIGLPRYRRQIHKLRKRVGKRLNHEIVHTLHAYDLSVTAIIESIVGREIAGG